MDVMQVPQMMTSDVAAGNLIQQGRIFALHSVPWGFSFASGGRDPADSGPFTRGVNSGIHHVTNIADPYIARPACRGMLEKSGADSSGKAANSRPQSLEQVPSREVTSSVS
jgi:hypothetical protein